MHAARVRKSAWKAPERRQRAHTHTKVPEPDGRLDVADVLPGAGLARPSEQEQVLPVRAFEPDALECEGGPRVSFPARALDHDAVEHAVAEDTMQDAMQNNHADRPCRTTIQNNRVEQSSTYKLPTPPSEREGPWTQGRKVERVTAMQTKARHQRLRTLSRDHAWWQADDVARRQRRAVETAAVLVADRVADRVAAASALQTRRSSSPTGACHGVLVQTQRWS